MDLDTKPGGLEFLIKVGLSDKPVVASLIIMREIQAGSKKYGF